jgi:hypothetical protein
MDPHSYVPCERYLLAEYFIYWSEGDPELGKEIQNFAALDPVHMTLIRQCRRAAGSHHAPAKKHTASADAFP